MPSEMHRPALKPRPTPPLNTSTRRLYTYGLTLRAFRLCHVSTKVLVMAAFVLAKLRPNFTAFCPTDCADDRRTSVMLPRRSPRARAHVLFSNRAGTPRQNGKGPTRPLRHHRPDNDDGRAEWSPGRDSPRGAADERDANARTGRHRVDKW